MTRLLNYQTYGTPTDATPLLIVHGLFGAGRNWRAIAKRLSADRLVITVDMRNHGQSFWDDSHTYFDLANDLGAVISEVATPMDVLGHSMGGKAAMVLAIQNPELVARLMVVDIAPVEYAHSQISNIKIMQSIPLDKITRRSEADAIMAESLNAPELRAFLLQSLILDETGNRWSLNLSALHENMDNIIGFPNLSKSFERPALFIRGALSDYVKEDDLNNIKRLFPNAQITTIENAGHWVHAQAQRVFIATVQDYLGVKPAPARNDQKPA